MSFVWFWRVWIKRTTCVQENPLGPVARRGMAAIGDSLLISLDIFLKVLWCCPIHLFVFTFNSCHESKKVNRLYVECISPCKTSTNQKGRSSHCGSHQQHHSSLSEACRFLFIHFGKGDTINNEASDKVVCFVLQNWWFKGRIFIKQFRTNAKVNVMEENGCGLIAQIMFFVHRTSAWLITIRLSDVFLLDKLIICNFVWRERNGTPVPLLELH